MLNYYLYDTFCAQSDAKIPVWDLSVTRGLCAFDYLRTYNKLPFHLDDHIARLFNSAKNLGLSPPKTADQISSIIHTLIANTTLDGEVGIKLLITGGTPEDYLLPTESKFIAWTQPPPIFLPNIMKEASPSPLPPQFVHAQRSNMPFMPMPSSTLWKDEKMDLMTSSTLFQMGP